VRVTVSLHAFGRADRERGETKVEAAAAPATVDGKSLPDMPLALRLEEPGRSEGTFEP